MFDKPNIQYHITIYVQLYIYIHIHIPVAGQNCLFHQKLIKFFFFFNYDNFLTFLDKRVDRKIYNLKAGGL